ncbi:hypothetical protein SRABI26_00376 [Arthrobacter sp. Bi26]|nr:hypothetical protein SRABI26_00376 [Arthrobacter sp. Bi26]
MGTFLGADREAAADFQRVVDEIRRRPGFERFLMPRKVAKLLPAATDGPVVLLNVAQLRSDALRFELRTSTAR